MQNSHFYSFGKKIYQFRWFIIIAWICIVIACVPFLPSLMTPFKTTRFINTHSSSTKVQTQLDNTFGSSANRIIVLYNSKKWLATNLNYQNEIKKSLQYVKEFSWPVDVIYPTTKGQMSKDKHAAYAVIIINKADPLNHDELDELNDLIKPPAHLTMQLGGESVFNEGINKQTQKDLYKADFIATPVSLITLLLVFGSVIAAIIPILLGGGCALIILTTLYFFAHLFSLSIYTINIAMLLGLCLSLDYSLFIINRFRQELKEGRPVQEAIAVTQATAGEAVFFSGLTVFVSLSALLFFPINILFSVGIGGLSAVFIAVFTAVILLPALLSVLKTNINVGAIRLFKRKDDKSHFWNGLANRVVKRPFIYFSVMFAFMLFLGYPFLHAKFGISDYHILPKGSESRLFFDNYNKFFSGDDLNPIVIVAATKPFSVLSKQGIDVLYTFGTNLKSNPSINSVSGIVLTEPRLSRNAYYQLYNQKRDQLPDEVNTLLTTTTTDHITVMNVMSRYHIDSPQTKSLMKDIKNMQTPKGLTIKLTGLPVNNNEVIHTIAKVMPYAILWIMILTYLTLLYLLKSVFLPLKAIVMNILSLSASYGMLVFTVQEGHLHKLLNFEPQGMLDISLLIIIFCALFGFSMDYEVFLLTRIKEAYEKFHDTKRSIIFGIEHSSRIITSAALIVVFICCSFMVADVLMVKAFGLGIAVAIFVDAFLIRTMLVPATMAIMNKWNWYLPKWLK